jgi:hypothetical protein
MSIGRWIAVVQTSGAQAHDVNTPGASYIVAALIVAILVLMVTIFVQTSKRH